MGEKRCWLFRTNRLFPERRRLDAFAAQARAVISKRGRGAQRLALAKLSEIGGGFHRRNQNTPNRLNVNIVISAVRLQNAISARIFLAESMCHYVAGSATCAGVVLAQFNNSSYDLELSSAASPETDCRSAASA
jgi:hypothetical protein